MTVIHTNRLSAETIEAIKEDYEDSAEKHRQILENGVPRYEGDLYRTEQALEEIDQKIHSLTIDIREKNAEGELDG